MTGDRPRALVQPGDSKTTCIYPGWKGWGLAGLESVIKPVDQVTGLNYNCIVSFSTADPTWSAWVDPWVTRPGYGYAAWLAADPKRRTVVLTQNLVPDDVAKQPGWDSTCASGAFANYDVELARNLVRTGFAYSVIRLGPEMNGNWNYDSLGTTPVSWKAWAECFAAIVVAMRSVPGGHFLFDWNVNAGYRPIPLGAYYPGNKYVDIIGVDAYDASGVRRLPPAGSGLRWQQLSTEPSGLDAVARFAFRHGKPLSIPEWGTVATSAGGAGDDASYVLHMGQFIAHHDVAFDSWFDNGYDSVNALGPSAPKSLAAYVAEFGPSSAIQRYRDYLVHG